MDKIKLLVSFSGGRTSAFMAHWLKQNKSDVYDMVFVFANTGLERFETLQFVQKCNYEFELDVKFIEASINPEKGVGTTYHLHQSILTLSSVGDHNTPFEQMIKKYGLPNPSFPHCTRELKTVPIYKFGKDYFGTSDFYQAIGIRIDEIDRVSKDRVKKKLIYPLVSDIPTTKHEVDLFWRKQKFDLELNGYEGNCSLCWKKDIKKLALICQERPHDAMAFYALEAKYKVGYTNGRINRDEYGVRDVPVMMYRGQKSIEEISKLKVSKDEVFKFKNTVQESCDIHSECGLDN